MGKSPSSPSPTRSMSSLPGHVHLTRSAASFRGYQGSWRHPREFNTMAVDDGIAMRSPALTLPSATSSPTRRIPVTRTVPDALICIELRTRSPGMLMAALRLQYPDRVRSPVADGWHPRSRRRHRSKEHRPRRDVRHRRRQRVSDEELLNYEKTVSCPTCGSCAGMFTANSMNCLTGGHRPSPARSSTITPPTLPPGPVSSVP